MRQVTSPETPRRFVKAARLKSGDVTLDHFAVRDWRGSRIGRLTGVIIDPGAQRVCSLVVRAERGCPGRRRVLPLCGARLDTPQRVLVLFESDTVADHSSHDGCLHPSVQRRLEPPPVVRLRAASLETAW